MEIFKNEEFTADIFGKDKEGKCEFCKDGNWEEMDLLSEGMYLEHLDNNECEFYKLREPNPYDQIATAPEIFGNPYGKPNAAYMVIADDNVEDNIGCYGHWCVPIRYCPFCGKKL